MSVPTSVPAMSEVQDDFGGELEFWIAVVRGKVPAGVLALYARAAQDMADRGDDGPLTDLDSLLDPAAAKDLDAVLDVGPCLVDALPGVISTGDPVVSPRPVTELVRAGVLDLLTGAGVESPPRSEVVAGGELVRTLTGWESLEQFELHIRWLADVRRRRAAYGRDRPPARLRIVERLEPRVFATRPGGGYRHHVSYRLYLRGQLLRECGREKWVCRHPAGLNAALGAVTREQIGESFSRSLAQLAAGAVFDNDQMLQYVTLDVVAVAS